jgi:hypothetical protein
LTIGTDETALDMTAIGGGGGDPLFGRSAGRILPRRHDERAIVENPPAFG